MNAMEVAQIYFDARKAMRKFFSPELSAGGYTSVWIPARINTL